MLASLIWVAHHDRWTLASWDLPTDYTGDAHETLARLKASSEGELRPLVPQVIERLGAPFGATWNAYATPDKPLMVALGAIIPAIGLNAAANFGLLLAQISAALAFYFVARWLRCHWSWAIVGALLFAYTYHSFHRGLAHFSLVFTWTVPLGLLAIWLVAGSRRLEWRSSGALVCLGSAAALGISNPYNLFFWLQLMACALLMQYFGQRRGANLQIGLAAVAIAVLGFFITNAEVWLFVENTNALPLLTRNYGGTERYALKPVEMFIPPEFHRWDWLAFFGHRYVRWSEWRGEIFLPYLGLAGMAGFISLAVVTARAIFERRRLPGQALSIGWLLAYASIGGITNLLAFFVGLQVFRATNRAAIFISAIVLLFLVVRLSRWTARWPRWLSATVAIIVGIVGLLDQLPRPEPRDSLDAMARAVEIDRELGKKIEAALPRGAMVFQLPVLGFPEVVPPYRLDSYEHFRPYLFTESLRFTYGTPKFRARSRWQREVERLPPAELVRCLESYGFAAVYINRKGFADRGEALLAQLATLGYTRRVQVEGSAQVLVPLHPSPTPLLPLAHTFSYGRGWHQNIDSGTRWAYEDATLSYFNPYPHPIRVDLDFRLVAVGPREVSLRRDGQVIGRSQVNGRDAEQVSLRSITMQPGINLFTMESPGRATRVNSRQLRSFGIQRSLVQVTPRLDPLWQHADWRLADR